jgi:hypothetical protein
MKIRKLLIPLIVNDLTIPVAVVKVDGRAAPGNIKND